MRLILPTGREPFYKNKEYVSRLTKNFFGGVYATVPNQDFDRVRRIGCSKVSILIIPFTIRVPLNLAMAKRMMFKLEKVEYRSYARSFKVDRPRIRDKTDDTLTLLIALRGALLNRRSQAPSHESMLALISILHSVV